MKAFVIKNKKGKYFDKEIKCFCEPDYVCCEHIYYTADDAKHHIDYYGLKDCKVVEITIAEGDLEQENKQLKEQLTEQIDYKDEYYYYWKDTQKENTILKKALKLSCETIKQYIKIVFNEDYDFSYEHFIDRAKEELKNEKRKS